MADIPSPAVGAVRKPYNPLDFPLPKRTPAQVARDEAFISEAVDGIVSVTKE
jgi:hypothetical protein